MSASSNFVALLGEKCGYRPLPAVIPAVEFQALTRILEEENPEVNRLLQCWYGLNENVYLPQYELRRLAPMSRDDRQQVRAMSYGSELSLRNLLSSQWAEESNTLRLALRRAAEAAHFTDAEMTRYEWSGKREGPSIYQPES